MSELLFALALALFCLGPLLSWFVEFVEYVTDQEDA